MSLGERCTSVGDATFMSSSCGVSISGRGSPAEASNAATQVSEGIWVENTFALLAMARAYRVSEIWRPRDPENQGAGRRGRAQRAALAAGYHAGITGTADGTVAFGWIRTVAGGSVHILTVGDTLVGSADVKAG